LSLTLDPLQGCDRARVKERRSFGDLQLVSYFVGSGAHIEGSRQV
jgi:hypothetical protein